MAYIYMPLFFSILSYGIVYLLSQDLVSLATNVSSLLISNSEPTFTVEYKNVFEPGSVEVSEDNTVSIHDVYLAEYGELYAHLSCERIGLDCPVYMGDSNDILKLGAGQIPVTYQPGFGWLIMIGAHNNTFFNCLKNVEVGDVIYMETSYGTYSYQVNNTEVMDISGGKEAYDFMHDYEELVLYTCYPFDMLSHTDYRFIVYATLLDGPTFVYD
jgi:sortase A